MPILEAMIPPYTIAHYRITFKIGIHTMLPRCMERNPLPRLRDLDDARLELEQPAAVETAAAPGFV
jgi:hypothetical protein